MIFVTYPLFLLSMRRILPAPKHSYSVYDDVDSDEEAEKFAALEAKKK